METITTGADLRTRLHAVRAQGRSIGLVTTMGALHVGHVSLVEIAQKRGYFVVVSIFVNPLQFSSREDLEKYPRTLAEDSKLAESHGVDLLFAPSTGEIYPEFGDPNWNPAELCTVKAGSAALEFEGRFRPGHFDGVVTVVSTLFNLVQPDLAVFSEKDFQQLQVIRQMVRDLKFPVEIIAAPILRDPDGLAMSSRNRRLIPEQRTRALAISRALSEARRQVAQGDRNARSVTEAAKHRMEEEFNLKVEYVAIVDPATLQEVVEITEHSRMLIVAWVDEVRLIDTTALVRGSAK